MQENTPPEGRAGGGEAAPTSDRTPLPPEFAEALEAASVRPEDEAVWERIEELSETYQRPEEVEELFAALLGRPLESAIAERLGVRAVRFHDEWSAQPGPLTHVLSRLLEIDVGIDWAFQRLTLLFTAGERWDELLALYDKSLAATSDLGRRRELLDEAAHVAKDFAGQPDRAIGYLEQLFAMRPTDAKLTAQLERLLEARSRHADLVRVWSARLRVLPAELTPPLRLKIALAHLDHLQAPQAAVTAVEPLLASGVELEGARDVLERVASSEAAPAESKVSALSLLRAQYASLSRRPDVLRVIEAQLPLLAQPEARAEAHRAAAQLWAEGEDFARALDHQASLLTLTPDDDETLARLRALGASAQAPARLAAALADAAQSALTGGQALRASSLLVEAARTSCEQAGDEAKAADWYLAIFDAAEANADDVIEAGEQLPGLLDRTGRRVDLLRVLEKLAREGRAEGQARIGLLGRAARLGEELGELERALAAWEMRLAERAEDEEARDARIELLDRMKRWEPLLEALRTRADGATSEQARRSDLVRVAKVVAHTVGDTERAIEAWRQIERSFGRSDDSVDALCDLHLAAGDVSALEALLTEAIDETGAGARRAALLARLGDHLLGSRGDRASAFSRYAAALQDVPSHAGARTGLAALVGELTDEADEITVQAVATLVEASGRAEDWAATIALTEQRLRIGADDAERARVLVETARLEELRADDAAAAQRSLGRALSLAPYATRIEADLLRLSELSGDWQFTAEAYAKAIDAVGAGDDNERVAALLMAQGEVYEGRLEERASALGAFVRVLVAAPQTTGVIEAVVRNAARLGAWQYASAALVSAATLSSRLEQSLVSLFEESCDGAWAEALAQLDAATLAAAEQISPRAAHDLFAQTGRWYRDQLGDEAQAERALQAASERDPADVATLEALTALQRGAPSLALIQTLERLSSARGGESESLFEASTVALETLGDKALGARLLERSLAATQARWALAEPGSATWLTSAASAARSIDRLVAVRVTEGELTSAAALLVVGAGLPFEASAALSLLLRAAGLFSERGDHAQASSLYRRVLEQSPDNRAALDALAEILVAEGDAAALVELRRHELSLAPPLDSRLALRLEIASLSTDEPSRIAVLRENLTERPGHDASIAALSTVLEGAGELRALADVLADQAALVETAGDTAEARALWSRVAEIAELHLEDVAFALDAQQRAASIEETPPSLDALARLHMARGEHAHAVPYLERRLSLAADDERTSVVLRLASSLAGAGQDEAARVHLETSLAREPRDKAVRAQLASLYRAGESWADLVTLLLTGAEVEDELQAKVALLLEAADIQQRKLASPDEAVELLRKASALSPQDRSLRAGLADALRGAGQHDEARALLEALVEEYGRRRPPERAAVHFQLAQLARDKGDVTEALAQLEIASSVDMTHAGVLELLGALSTESGQLERAERTYRALLLTLRRQRPDAVPSGTLSVSEVQLALWRTAQAQGQEERAAELLESAFDTAAQSAAEAGRLERSLRASGEPSLLLRAQRARLARVGSSAEEAIVLTELALTLESLPGHGDEAFDVRLRVLSLSPEDGAAHDSLRALAAQSGPSFVARYAAQLEQLAARSITQGSAQLGASLWLRLGELLEAEGGNQPRALWVYEQAERASDELRAFALRASVRLARELGDRASLLRSLRALTQVLTDELEPSELVETLYELAALELSDVETHEGGAQSLSRAIEREARPEAALALLREAAPAIQPAVIALYERVARDAGSDEALLDALEYASQLPEATSELLQEAVSLAERIGKGEQAETLLRRAVEIGSSEGHEPAVWAMVSLAARCSAAGDHAGAFKWLSFAAESAPGEEGYQRGLEAAQVAAEHLGDLERAAEVYRALLGRDLSDRRAWEPLLALYRGQGRHDDTEALLAQVAPHVLDAADRRLLRMEQVQLLLAASEREADAVAVLEEMLDDDPDDEGASEQLLSLLERSGRVDEFVRQLTLQLEGARSRGDGAAVARLSVKLSAELAATRRDEALTLLRDAAEVAPDDRGLLAALLDLLGPQHDAEERLSLMERLLAQENGEAASKLTLQLVDAFERAGDEAAVERVLITSFGRVPENQALRVRLERTLTARESWPALAQMFIDDAARKTGAAALATFRKAAQIYQERLGDLRAAAGALSRARAAAPADIELLRELTSLWSASDQQQAAIDEVSAALDAAEGPASLRVKLLRLRAALLLAAGAEPQAAHDLEQAIGLGDKSALPELITVLEQRLQATAAAGDAQSERDVMLRLCELLGTAGDHERSRAILGGWAQRFPGDAEVLRALLALDVSQQAWASVVSTSYALLSLEAGEGRIELALLFADACTKLGQAGDARPMLEAIAAEFPSSTALRDRLRALYEEAGLFRELAGIYLTDVAAIEDEAARFEPLKKAGDLYLAAGDGASALPCFQAALAIKPNDHDAIVSTVDAMTATSQLTEATALLDATIAAHKNRRSPQLSMLQHRMARVAYFAGDRNVELAWLGVALDSDMQNGQVATELAELAMELGQLDAALKALRAVTVMKNPGPMTKAQAYLRQGIIAYHQGDPRKAVVLAKKAQSEDPNLGEVRAFLDQIGEKLARRFHQEAHRADGAP